MVLVRSSWVSLAQSISSLVGAVSFATCVLSQFRSLPYSLEILEYHRISRTATMGACYSQLPASPISFPSSFATPSHLWSLNKDSRGHSHITFKFEFDQHPREKNNLMDKAHNVYKEQVSALLYRILSCNSLSYPILCNVPMHTCQSRWFALPLLSADSNLKLSYRWSLALLRFSFNPD